MDQPMAVQQDALIAGLEGMLFRAFQELVLASILDQGKTLFDVIEYQEMWHRCRYLASSLPPPGSLEVAGRQLEACPHAAKVDDRAVFWEFTGSGLVALRKVELPTRSG